MKIWWASLSRDTRQFLADVLILVTFFALDAAFVVAFPKIELWVFYFLGFFWVGQKVLKLGRQTEFYEDLTK